MRQYLKNEVFKVSKWVELFISAIIMIAVIGGTIYLVKDVVQLMMNYPTSRDIYKFVGVAFNLVICIEFVKMLCKHTPDNELVHVEIPKETQHQTLGELLEKRIGTESGNFQVGQCYFFEGGALRVAKVKNGKITQIEVIRSKNAPVVLKR